MWQELWACMSQRRVALCVPGPNGPIELIYWYGILAAVGIFLGAFYASKHLEMEGEDPDIVWDALLWVLIPALVGARLWYVVQAVLGGSTAYSLSRPLEIINPRLGGMNIFGGVAFGVIALLIYIRVKKIKGWLLADAALMGLLIGQGIGRFGNFINQELYGPPTGSDWFGMIIPPEARLPQFASLPPETRFHPTMLYEAFWLFLSFAILYYIFRRYQPRLVHGVLTGAYFILAGFGRFIMEFWRPDQPLMPLPDIQISYSRFLSMIYVVVGLIILLDRLGYLRIPFIPPPQTPRQRERAFEALMTERRRRERARERERLRAQRRKERRQQRASQENVQGQSGDS
ncbi:MAG TPA: prolipoprotein diacylglyceryl transferase [Chloroflexi bacterium]|nr:prolipoprotein diacylglyceryl transferase [Chloroflexota bacterium]